jgi:hypothetical protein
MRTALAHAPDENVEHPAAFGGFRDVQIRQGEFEEQARQPALTAVAEDGTSTMLTKWW